MLFQALATNTIPDLATIKGSQQTRAIPRHRRSPVDEPTEAILVKKPFKRRYTRCAASSRHAPRLERPLPRNRRLSGNSAKTAMTEPRQIPDSLSNARKPVRAERKTIQLGIDCQHVDSIRLAKHP